MSDGAILWRRLDEPGHDACRLTRDGDGWRVEGSAVFRHASGPASLAYHTACDAEWRTTDARVAGWIGAARVDLIVRRDADGWTVNGARVPGLADRPQLDFGFTPATNLFQLRGLALAIGDAGEAPVAWIDAPEGVLQPLDQRYERRAAGAYWYVSRQHAYEATLLVRDDGFVREYPGLWVEEA